MAEKLEDGALKVIRRLTDRGFEAYMVGGCVRDKWLGRKVKDYDIATSARPEQVQSIFERTIPTGLQHGTVTVLIDRVPYEVTTFRKEGDYEGFRRPSEVEYIDNLHEDLQRRDFTMNAMALDQDGRLIDPFGGQEDLRLKRLRCVGQAEERFREDALRMLRCLRFAAEYGLEPETATWSALLLLKPLLGHIAMERVQAELLKMLAGANPNLAVDLLCSSGVLQHTKKKLSLASIADGKPWPNLDRLPDELHRLAFLYIRIGATAEQADADMRHLACSKQQTEKVRLMVTAHERLRNEAGNNKVMDDMSMDQRKRLWLLAAIRYGRGTLRNVHKLYSQEEHLSPSQRVWVAEGERWLDEMPVSEVSELAVTGQELMRLFAPAKPGPWLGRLLAALLEETALGELSNETEALLKAAEAHYEQIREIERQ
ncbi:CCA tRNA nucleotidyltransferase [Paenibacillus allorhizosphaerae]|uniref:CCA-adding enzyme n=1 Tax=Paenibacillus allorhizosphaerae TaxID=2849866 RepID=A0ABN7TNR4_9BACL|nr:CCA tRNA nucleotidyltransferase [Paenibacillus allorhizosphaerae]CAG7648808.1 CCA-adding enzyme [Paenibacillus allorhizosphaerae]